MNRTVPIALALLLAVAPSAAQEMQIPLVTTFENEKYRTFYDYLAGNLDGAVAGGHLIVVATQPPGTAKLATLRLADGTMAVYADVSARMAAPPDPEGRMVGPGILVRDGTTNGKRGFYMLLLQPDGYLISAWLGGAITQSIGGSLDPDVLAKPVRLAAKETERGAEFFVNGESVAAIEDSQIAGRGLGIVSWGSGTFTFDNLGLNSTGEIGLAALAEPAPVGTPPLPAASGAAPVPAPAPGGPPPLPAAPPAAN